MNKLKVILSYLLGFILSVSISVLCLLLILKFGIFNKNYLLDLLKTNNYYESINNSIKEDIEDYMTSSGLPNSVMDEVFSLNDVEKDINGYIDSLYEGKVYNVDTTVFEDKLKNNINDYVKSLNLGIDNTDELDLFIKDTADIYTKEVKLYNMLDGLANKYLKLSHILSCVLIGACVIVGVFSILIIIFNKINIGSCIMSSGIIMILFRLFIFDRIDSDNILIISEYFSKIFKRVMNNINNLLLIIGIVLMVVGFVITFVKIPCKKRG